LSDGDLNPACDDYEFTGITGCGGCDGVTRIISSTTNAATGCATGGDSGGGLADSVIVSIAALCIGAVSILVTALIYTLTTLRALTKAKEDLLRDLDKEYHNTIAPAITYIQRITKSHANGALWTALQDRTLRSDPTVTHFLDKTLDDELLVRTKIAQSRQIINGFWSRFTEHIINDHLPNGYCKPPKCCCILYLGCCKRCICCKGSSDPTEFDLVDHRKGPLRYQRQWLVRATEFRVVVEPFDIVDWYLDPIDTRANKPYSKFGRRYVYLLAEQALFQQLWKAKDAEREKAAAAAAGTAKPCPVEPPTYENSMVWCLGCDDLQGANNSLAPTKRADIPSRERSDDWVKSYYEAQSHQQGISTTGQPSGCG